MIDSIKRKVDRIETDDPDVKRRVDSWANIQINRINKLKSKLL